MSDSQDIQALEKITSEVDESHVKIILSNQCIKAQQFLLDRLKKETERQRVICKYISSNNLKLDTEIRHGEQELNSKRISYETIKASNVEHKKDLLLAKERKQEISERVTNGEKKYEDLWIQCKDRYESIEYVKNYLDAKNYTQTLETNLDMLQNEYDAVRFELKEKRVMLNNKDKNLILKLAEYVVNENPKNIKRIKELSAAIDIITNQIEEIMKSQDNVKINIIEALQIPDGKSKPEAKMEEDSNLRNKHIKDDFMIPELQMSNFDLDILTKKLDQIKKVNTTNTADLKRTDSGTIIIETNNTKKFKKAEDVRSEFTSCYFNKYNLNENESNSNCNKDYSKKKLINIIEDIRVDKIDAFRIVAEANVGNMQEVDAFTADISKNATENIGNQEKEVIVAEDEIIEEIDLTISNNVVIPPTPFLDNTQYSQQEVQAVVHMSMDGSPPALRGQINVAKDKKKVSFEVPNSGRDIISTHNDNVGDLNTTNNSQLDISEASDESYTRIKDMILKKHQLDCSPTFNYAKNSILQKIDQISINNTVTSKFFTSAPNEILDKGLTDVEKENIMEVESQNEDDPKLDDLNAMETNNEFKTTDVANISPKINPILTSNKHVSGILFDHGTQGIPDSLNVSINTTGFEDADMDYPQCIDSSLLLSPKADDMAKNIEVTSQEVPNFLSGLRKTGLSFFGQAPSGANSNSQNPDQGNNFNFNFSGDGKKTRGGLFSMFQ